MSPNGRRAYEGFRTADRVEAHGVVRRRDLAFYRGPFRDLVLKIFTDTLTRTQFQDHIPMPFRLQSPQHPFLFVSGCPSSRNNINPDGLIQMARNTVSQASVPKIIGLVIDPDSYLSGQPYQELANLFGAVTFDSGNDLPAMWAGFFEAIRAGNFESHSRWYFPEK